ncbi:uncharacterized protein LOC125958138 [Anopheles darlingi]|uniref:uncharacterized protein LOC125958138 n=1 Tax=Anopheles darlingi TaxID=43151 RepID=UPI0021005193|nr:uncharacterized protein LOC125958138 [Anopheles darlingi]
MSVYWIALWAVVTSVCHNQAEGSVRITNYTDDWDAKYLDVDLRVRRLDKTTAIDFDLDLKQVLDKNVEYDVRLCRKIAGKYHQMMYTGKQQVCGMETRRSRNLLDRYIASELVKHSNLTTRCPISTGHYELIVQVNRVEVTNANRLANCTASVRKIGASSNYQSYFHIVLRQAVTDARVG